MISQQQLENLRVLRHCLEESLRNILKLKKRDPKWKVIYAYQTYFHFVFSWRDTCAVIRHGNSNMREHSKALIELRPILKKWFPFDSHLLLEKACRASNNFKHKLLEVSYSMYSSVGTLGLKGDFPERKY